MSGAPPPAALFAGLYPPPTPVKNLDEYPEFFQLIEEVLGNPPLVQREVPLVDRTDVADVTPEEAATQVDTAAPTGTAAVAAEVDSNLERAEAAVAVSEVISGTKRRSERLAALPPTKPFVAACASVGIDVDDETAGGKTLRAERRRRATLIIDATRAATGKKAAAAAKRIKTVKEGISSAERQGRQQATQDAFRAAAKAVKAESKRADGETIAVRRDATAQTDEQYRLASENIFPLLMISLKGLETRIGTATGSISFSDLFILQLSSICDRVYGPALRDRIQSASPKGKLRKFFEATDAKKQCIATIGKYTAETPCWICDEKVGLGVANAEDTKTLGSPECEHKLPVSWALILAGLYDADFAASLAPAARLTYTNVLTMEYAWAHSRCNQIKNDDLYIQGTIVGDAEKTVRISLNPTTTEENLTRIISKYYRTYKPTHEKLRTMVGIPPKPQTAWVGERVKAIGGQLDGLMTKFNTANFKVKHLVTRLVGGLLNRAVVFAEAIVRDVYAAKGLTPPLTPEQRANIKAAFTRVQKPLPTEPSGGARHKTIRTPAGRARTYRSRQRGGEDDLTDEQAVLLWDIADSLTKATCVHALRQQTLARVGTVEQEQALQINFLVGAETLAFDALTQVLATVTDETSPEIFMRDIVITVDQLARETQPSWLKGYLPLEVWKVRRSWVQAMSSAPVEEGAAAAAEPSETRTPPSEPDDMKGKLETPARSVGEPAQGTPGSLQVPASDPRLNETVEPPPPSESASRSTSAPSSGTSETGPEFSAPPPVRQPSASAFKGGFVLGLRPDWL